MSTHAVTGAVLAGGASRRMGRDKALIDVGGRTLIDRALDVMADFDQVVVLGGSAQVAQICSRRGVEVLADVHPGSGPLMAILTAVEQVGDVVAMAVDMAGVQAAMVDAVRAGGDARGVDIAVATSLGEVQPALARWNASIYPAAMAAVDDGVRSLFGVVGRDEVSVVQVEVGAGVGINLNTPADVAIFNDVGQ